MSIALVGAVAIAAVVGNQAVTPDLPAIGVNDIVAELSERPALAVVSNRLRCRTMRPMTYFRSLAAVPASSV
jgi:hypothetical protein